MFTYPSPTDMECDAPPDTIIDGCKLLGLYRPWDVRWCRLNDCWRSPGGWLRWLWRQLRGESSPNPPQCICGWRFPPTIPYILRSESESQGDYVFGQCPRCHTIFWEERRITPRDSF